MERAENAKMPGFSVASLILGIAAVLCGLIGLQTGVALYWIIAAAAALAGLILGVIGLVKSIRRSPKSVAGIVLASIGIAICLGAGSFFGLLLGAVSHMGP